MQKAVPQEICGDVGHVNAFCWLDRDCAYEKVIASSLMAKKKREPCGQSTNTG